MTEVVVIVESSDEGLWDTSSNVKDDAVFWVLMSLLVAFVLIICVGFSYVSVNINRNLGSTLVSPAEFYPGQFLQNEEFILTFTTFGILQLSSQKTGLYWYSSNENNFSTYGLVCKFDITGSLSVQNYYGQTLWNISPEDNSHPGPYILKLAKNGNVQVKSVDGSEILCFPNC